jgi:hypothetical protein
MQCPFTTPMMSKEDVARLQSEKQWNEISPEKLHELENLGYGKEED